MRHFPLALVLAIAPLHAEDRSSDRQASLSDLEKNTAAIEDLTQKVEALTRLLKTEMVRNSEELRQLRQELAGRQKLEPSQAGTAPTQETVPAAVPVASAIPAQTAGIPGLKHTVQKGETLTSIAKQYGITIEEISKANKIQDARKLQVGQELIIPATTQPAQPTETKNEPKPE